MMKRGEKGPGFGFLTAGDGKKNATISDWCDG
jgi:hypothetical protein